MDRVRLDFQDGRRPLELPASAVVRLPQIAVSLEIDKDADAPSSQQTTTQTSASQQHPSSSPGAPAPRSSSPDAKRRIITVPHLTREEFTLALNKVSPSPFLTAKEEAALAEACDLELVDQADCNFPTGRASVYHLLDYLGVDISAYKTFVEGLWWTSGGFRSKRAMNTGSSRRGGADAVLALEEERGPDAVLALLEEERGPSLPAAKRRKMEAGTSGASPVGEDVGGTAAAVVEAGTAVVEAGGASSSSVVHPGQVQVHPVVGTSADVVATSATSSVAPGLVPNGNARWNNPWGDVIDLHDASGKCVFKVEQTPLLPPDLLLLEPRNGVKYEDEISRMKHAAGVGEDAEKEEDRRGRGGLRLSSLAFRRWR